MLVINRTPPSNVVPFCLLEQVLTHLAAKWTLDMDTVLFTLQTPGGKKSLPIDINLTISELGIEEGSEVVASMKQDAGAGRLANFA